MKVNSVNFKKALRIISKSNSPKLSINVPISDSYSKVYPILLHDANPSLIQALQTAGFMLSMTEKGLSVDHLYDQAGIEGQEPLDKSEKLVELLNENNYAQTMLSAVLLEVEQLYEEGKVPGSLVGRMKEAIFTHIVTHI